MINRLNKSNLPAGLRNNNAGNIRISNTNWVGKIPQNQNTSGVHEQFISSEYGLRALFKQIDTTIARNGTGLLSMFVQDYAAGSSPEILKAYSDVLNNYVGKAIVTSSKEDRINMAKGIAFFENGFPANQMSNNEYLKGWELIKNNQVIKEERNLQKGVSTLFGFVLVSLLIGSLLKS